MKVGVERGSFMKALCAELREKVCLSLESVWILKLQPGSSETGLLFGCRELLMLVPAGGGVPGCSHYWLLGPV